MEVCQPAICWAVTSIGNPAVHSVPGDRPRAAPGLREALPMRSTGSAADLERRRIREVELVEQGESPDVVARILGIHPRSLSRWRRGARQEGGLKSKQHSGRPARLTAQDCQRLEALLMQGAEAHGWP